MTALPGAAGPIPGPWSSPVRNPTQAMPGSLSKGRAGFPALVISGSYEGGRGRGCSRRAAPGAVPWLHRGRRGMAQLRCVVVVGASLGGLRTAEALRRLGYDGRLVLVGEEAHRPYDRPPLSKELLRGERDAASIALAKPDRFDALGLDLRLRRRAR